MVTIEIKVFTERPSLPESRNRTLSASVEVGISGNEAHDRDLASEVRAILFTALGNLIETDGSPEPPSEVSLP